MTLEYGHSLGAIASTAHVTKGLTSALGGPPPRPSSMYHFGPDGLVIVVAYLVVLVILVVFGVLVRWQRHGRGGNGGGGGGPTPPAQEPTPPGGQQLTRERSPELTHAADFAAWEAQLRVTEDEPRVARADTRADADKRDEREA